MKNLSHRLEVIASLIKKGAKVCDVGTDHGYLPIHLIKSGKASCVIATDIRQKPLNTAKTNIEKACVSGIELRLCDGLSAVNSDEADTIVIAGMGGEVISGIIENCNWAKDEDNFFILQPMTSPEALRKYLYDSGFSITCEIPLEDNLKLYSVICCVYTGKPVKYESYELYIGKVPCNSCGYNYIKKQYDRVKACSDSLKNIPSKRDDYEYYKNIQTELYKIMQEK